MSNGPSITVGTNLPTPQQIALQQQLSAGLLQSAQQARPRTALQALAPIAQTGVAALLLNRAGQQQAARQQQANQALMNLINPTAPGGTGAPVAGVPGTGAAPGQQTASAGGVAPAVAPAAAGPGPVQAAPGGVAGGSPLGTLATQQRGPSTAALLQTVQQFPSLAPILNPMIAAQMQAPKTFTGVAAPGSQVFQGGQLVASVPAAQKEPKIVEVQDPSDPTKTMFVTPSQALAGGFAGVPRANFTVETQTGPDGVTRTILTRGSGATTAGGLSKPTTSKLEQGITQATTQLDRLQQIRANFNTKFLELPEQLKRRGLGALERLGVDVGPENRQQIRAFTRFASSATRNLNRLLNELSGAAVSPAEAKRLTAELPTIKDGPTEFMAKMEDAESAIAAAIRRNQQLLQGGVENLEFNARGEVTNAPDLDTFMLLEEPQQAVEASTTGAAPAGQPTQVLNFDSQGNIVE